MSGRDQQVNLRLSELELSSLDKTAKKAGKSRSEWMRDNLVSALGICPTCGQRRQTRAKAR